MISKKTITANYFSWIEDFTQKKVSFGTDERVLGDLELTLEDYENLKILDDFFDDVKSTLVNNGLCIESNRDYESFYIKKDDNSYCFARGVERPARVWISRIEGNDDIRKEIKKSSVDYKTIIELSNQKKLSL